MVTGDLELVDGAFVSCLHLCGCALGYQAFLLPRRERLVSPGEHGERIASACERGGSASRLAEQPLIGPVLRRTGAKIESWRR